MKQNRLIMDVVGMVRATERANHRYVETLRLARAMESDERKKERLDRHFCVACFYPARLAGQACTSRDCMSCSCEQMYGNTAADVLCIACARLHALCKHCGGDVDMCVDRKQWPKPPSEETVS